MFVIEDKVRFVGIVHQNAFVVEQEPIGMMGLLSPIKALEKIGVPRDTKDMHPAGVTVNPNACFITMGHSCI